MGFAGESNCGQLRSNIIVITAEANVYQTSWLLRKKRAIMLNDAYPTWDTVNVGGFMVYFKLFKLALFRFSVK